MSVNDPISDMLTRIRNAGMMRHAEVVMPSTKVLVQIARILREEGFIEGYRVTEQKPQNQLTVRLKYDDTKKHVIREIKRISKPGLRIYRQRGGIERVRNGLGVAIVTTSQGVMTGRDAYRRGVGGELLCTVS
ncbi:MAG: 30S ribosomal protein S8 [Thermomicrobia bacterium]|nr:30S ribosomal protein S8 [Thermomicrobia bacterium]